MNFNLLKYYLILLFMAVVMTGCGRNEITTSQARDPAASQTADTTLKISGRISVTDAGKFQPTGLAPVWIYDATNVPLTTKLPLPNFGGRTRTDWTRVVTAYPKSLEVYSAYEQLLPLAPDLEGKRIAATQKYLDKQKELDGRTSGPVFDAVTQLQAGAAQALAVENAAWDRADDTRDLIVFWYNLNPGILYQSGLPVPLATAQTDKAGNFSVTLPKSKKVLVAAHIEGTVAGRSGRYFWLLPFDTENSGTNAIALTGDNAVSKLEKTKLARVILPETNGFLGEVGFWMLNRVRDARAGL